MAPLKVSFFVGEATHGKIKTCDNLQKKGEILVNRCYMCKGDLEYVDLLLHCQFAGALLEFAFCCLDICWDSHHSIAIIFWLGKATLVGK